MRALLTLPTPRRDLTIADVTEALKETTWLPRATGDDHQVWVAERLKTLIEKFPSQVSDQLNSAEKIYIQVGLP